MGLIEKRRSGFARPEKPLGEVRVFSLVFEMFHGQKTKAAATRKMVDMGFYKRVKKVNAEVSGGLARLTCHRT